MVLAVPIIDTGVAFLRRLLAGKPLFSADREHTHHKLLDKGFKQHQVSFILYGFGALIGFYSLIFVNPGSKYIGYSLLILFIFLVVAVQRIGYDEFNELIRYITVGLRSQSKQLAGQIQIRKIFQNGFLHDEIITIEDVFDRLVIVFEEMGYDYISLRIWDRFLHQNGKGRLCLETS